jgi:flagellin
MIINDNVAALNTFNALSQNTSAMNKALSELSSGKQINSAADNASGLTISEQMQGQVNGLDQANSNAQDGISLIQTAEGGLTETTSILQRMRELAVQAANGTNTASDVTAIQDEVNQLSGEINSIATQTQFNGMTLLSGTYASGGTNINLQVGANSGQTMTINIGSMTMASLGVDGISANLSTTTGATAAITTIDSAISGVSALNSNLGAYQNRLTDTSDNLTTSSQNIDSANAQLVDVDMAKEMSQYTQDSVLVQAATSMLAQANQEPQSVLKLLQ